LHLVIYARLKTVSNPCLTTDLQLNQRQIYSYNSSCISGTLNVFWYELLALSGCPGITGQFNGFIEIK